MTTAPLFRVVKGNPTDTEIAALTTVLAQIGATARAQAEADRNLWGQTDPYRRDHLFNPNAFRNVTFY